MRVIQKSYRETKSTCGLWFCPCVILYAMYIHWHTHRLNLVLVDVVHNVEAAAEFVETVQMFSNFFSNSVAHDLFIKKQGQIESATQSVELKSLSDTRWACQYAALVAIQKSLSAIRATLLDIMSQPNVWRKTEEVFSRSYSRSQNSCLTSSSDL